MWLSSAKILYGLLIPLLTGMTAYGTSDTVRSTVQRYINPVPVADVVTPVDSSGWEAQVNQSLESIVKKLEKHETRIKNVEASSRRDDSSLQSQINALKAWHE